MRERAVEDWPEVFAEGARLGVSDDADDLIAGSAAFDAPADGVLVMENVVDEGLVDDGDFGRRGAFVGEYRGRRCGECPWFRSSRAWPCRDRRWARDRKALMAVGVKAVAAIAPGERRDVGADGGGDAGKTRRRDRAARPRNCVVRSGVYPWTRGSTDIMRTPLRAEADVDAGGALEAAQEESGDAEQDERDGEICETTRMLRRVQRRPGRASASSPLRALASIGREAAQAGASPKSRPAADAEREGVEQNAPIEADSDVERYGHGQMECGERGGSPEREDDAEHSAARRPEARFQ